MADYPVPDVSCYPMSVVARGMDQRRQCSCDPGIHTPALTPLFSRFAVMMRKGMEDGFFGTSNPSTSEGSAYFPQSRPISWQQRQRHAAVSGNYDLSSEALRGELLEKAVGMS